jgi:hypothetical protein
MQVGSAFSHLPTLLHLLEGTRAAHDPPPRALELLRAVLMCAVEVRPAPEGRPVLPHPLSAALYVLSMFHELCVFPCRQHGHQQQSRSGLA